MALIKVDVDPKDLLVYLTRNDIMGYMTETYSLYDIVSCIDDETIIEYLKNNGYTVGKEL